MIQGLHIEPTNICTLQCPECQRTRFIKKWPQHWKNQSIDIDQLLNFIDVDITDIRINFCGNYGDPIYHPEFLSLIKSFKQRSAIIAITTNGSYRTPEWWEQLCDLLEPRDQIEFSVDGIPENFTLYRKNANWASIHSGMKICVKSNIETVWKYIPFSFNEDTINQAKKLSDNIGIQKFKLSKSWRFDTDTSLTPSQSYLVDPKKTFQNKALTNQNLKVDALCNYGQGKEHFISAGGYYSPCCMLSDHGWYYKTEFGKNRSEYDISSTTISKILNRPKVIAFYKNIAKDPLVACQYQCPQLVDQ
jgi:wyosine [tRNA(Phe)-imidazoG37] synthetase (radical SAM superfamily)